MLTFGHTSGVDTPQLLLNQRRPSPHQMGESLGVMPASAGTLRRNTRDNMQYAPSMSRNASSGSSGIAKPMVSQPALRGMGLQEMRNFAISVQEEANKRGIGRCITIVELFDELVKLEGIDHRQHPFKNLESIVATNKYWHELPAVEYLFFDDTDDQEDDETDDESVDEFKIGKLQAICASTAIGATGIQAQGYKQNTENTHHIVEKLPNPMAYDARLEAVSGVLGSTVATQYGLVVPRKNFEASRKRQGIDAVHSANDLQRAKWAGLQLNSSYKGDITNFHLRNAYCTSEENSSVRVELIDPEATTAEIFQQIQEGKVFHFSRNPAKLPRHPFAAANVAFMMAKAARAFIHRAEVEGIYIRGHRLRVLPNRNMCQERGRGIDGQSRVLHIYGPAHYISAANVVAYLKKFVTFEPVECFQTRADRFGLVMVTIAFESIYGQSRQAKLCFEKNWLKSATGEPIHEQCCIGYGRDPCEPGPHGASGGWIGNRQPILTSTPTVNSFQY